VVGWAAPAEVGAEPEHRRWSEGRQQHDSGTFSAAAVWVAGGNDLTEAHMNGLIGLIVVILAILSFFGLR
jgi:hypothetical protein